MLSLSLSCLFFLPSTLGQEENKAPTPVKVSASLGTVNEKGDQTLTLTVEIDKGWHIYANKPGLKGLIGTTVTVKAATKLEAVEVDYPAGEETKDEVLGESYRQYVGTVKIPVKIRRAIVGGKPDESTLEVSIKYQACNERGCLAPQTLKLKVDRR
jgi:DsbC/DsbD-like thiol-disulfide interchange protein